jgi:hypothetical protein
MLLLDLLIIVFLKFYGQYFFLLAQHVIKRSGWLTLGFTSISHGIWSRNCNGFDLIDWEHSIYSRGQESRESIYSFYHPIKKPITKLKHQTKKKLEILNVSNLLITKVNKKCTTSEILTEMNSFRIQFI